MMIISTEINATKKTVFKDRKIIKKGFDLKEEEKRSTNSYETKQSSGCHMNTFSQFHYPLQKNKKILQLVNNRSPTRSLVEVSAE